MAGNTVGAFRPIFWNRITFTNQREHLVGACIDARHAAFSLFPTDDFTNWQWWDLMDHSKPMLLGNLPVSIKPLVQPIDDWNEARKLGLIFEVRVGRAKVLICSIDLSTDLPQRPTAAQLRASLVRYVSSDAFNPSTEVTPDQMGGLFREATMAEKFSAQVHSVSSEQQWHPASNILDGDPGTIWHTPWQPAQVPYPHELTIMLKEPTELKGVRLLPRQDGNRHGLIRQYELYVGTDASQWGSPVAAGELSRDEKPKEILFARPTTVQYLRLVAKAGFGDDHFASLAELELLP